MIHETDSVDALIADIYACLEEPAPKPPVSKPQPKPKTKPFYLRFLAVLGKIGLILVETVLLIAVALYGVMYVLAKGPSPTARDLFVRSVRETSAVGFLANLYFSEEEIAAIIGGVGTPDYVETDTSLIEIPSPTENTDPDQGPTPDAWGFVDDDGDGIIIDEVKGVGYTGYMMIVLDPSRVVMGSIPETFGQYGHTVEHLVKQYDAVAGINAGGFYDPDGHGNGSIPDTMVVYDGEVYYSELGSANGFAGFDENHILHVGSFTPEEIQQKHIRYGVGFGPVLVVNGEANPYLSGGVNPRTAIGQRSDGAVLMLVIEGRQVSSLGCTVKDLAEIFLDYGAVNACNMDGGSSSMMYYNGEYINDCASVVGIRPVPTSFLVLKKGGS